LLLTLEPLVYDIMTLSCITGCHITVYIQMMLLLLWRVFLVQLTD